MNRNTLVTTYRATAVAAIVCAPLGIAHPAFAVAALAAGIVAVLAHSKVHVELYAGGSPYVSKVAHPVNPATGLFMNGSVDTGGSPYGVDVHRR